MPATVDAPLARYRAKRNFKATPEPSGEEPKSPPRAAKGKSSKSTALGFVIQKHWASHLHYDFRLELDGVLVSWAVPKGPSFDPAAKQMAIHVEDHPTSYGSFEGSIPKGHYGAGNVIVWDQGTWEPVGDAKDSLSKGKLVFHLHGQKLAGLWELVRISKPDAKSEQWIFFKKRGDAWARPTAEYNVITALPDSVIASPLGLVEEREPRAAPVGRKPAAAAKAVDLSLARKSPLPAKLEPQLATLVTAAPSGGEWLTESKLDGYRMLARIEGGAVKLFTRNGHDWTHKLQAVADELTELGIKSGWLDGEIVIMNEHGLPDFNALQNAIDNSKAADIIYFLFDVPFLGDMDLRGVPLVSRRAVLKELLDERKDERERIRFSETIDASPAQLLEAACHMGLEGLMLKRADSPYTSARTETWLKLKCLQRQEFVVVGFTDRSGARNEVGGLLLGYHEKGVLRFAGSVGTGWSSATGREMHATLTKLIAEKPSVDAATAKPGRWSKRASGSERWVKPSMVVEVAFSEWTPDGHVRHPTFRGVRTDKPASAIGREVAKNVAGAPGGSAPSLPPVQKRTSIKVTNPDRVIDPSTGIKKVDLIHFYESIAERIIPHLKGRPVSLVRAPEGITKELFFQKHPESKMPGMKVLDPALWPGHTALLEVDSVEALLSAAQMNTVEFHTWNSTTKHIDQPDRVIFDLDPGEGVTWEHVQEAAQLMRALLSQLELAAWLKTSGGKGLHVVVPLVPKLSYEVVKGFSQAAVQHMAKTIPSRFVAKMGGGNRIGKIFIDYLRNGHAQTTAAAFSARSRPGLGVSMPIAWEQLPAVKSGAQWTIQTAREYLSFQKTDPWAGYWKNKQTLTKAMRMLGYKP